ncbi:MAG TPA: Tol-Pal system beta propeller repeat protein TolB [Candidatus Polarisedimenticolia bacterium]|nr:Tol-Pal system beta propeller repeat protein TolB [Candidatus Polarisedimenticolia bacterium]
MKRVLGIFLLLLALLSIARPAASQQGGGDVVLGISETAARRIPLAIPDFQAASSSATAKAADMITQTLRNDLDFSGFFAVVKPGLYSEVTGYSEKRVQYKDWLGIGAESVVLGKVNEEPGKIAVEGRLYDNRQEQLVMGRRYRGEADAARNIAHRLANEIVKQFTGQTGIFQTRITFVSQVGKAKEIFVMDYDGEQIKKLTSNGSLNLNPAWSPDGSKIAFLTYRTGRPELVILSSTGELKKAYPQPKGELNLSPDWSPDGTRIAFSGSRGGNAEIFVLQVSSGQVTRLTNSPALDTSPSWSPTGREIAFVSDRSGSPQVYLMDSEGSNLRRLTNEGSWNDLPAWSPKGDRIAYCSRLEGRFDIFVRDLATQKTTRLTYGPSNNEDPRWSPDGHHLVFSSDRSGNYDIYQMLADGSDVRRVTKGGRSFNPDWSR